MTLAEFVAAKIGHAREEDVQLKLLVWQVYHTMPAMKRRPSPKTLYRRLTDRDWTDRKEADPEDKNAKEKAISSLRELVPGKGKKTPKQNAMELSRHIFGKRKSGLNGG